MVESAYSGDNQTIRLGIVVSHPIPYFCSQYLSWSRLDGIDLRVFFASRHGLETYRDEEFATTIKWDGLALDFPHEFLPSAETRSMTALIDAPAVEGRLAEFRPHALCIYGYGQRLQRRAAAWARNAQVPVLMVTDSELRRKRSWIKRTAKAVLVPRLLCNVDRFLTTGDANEAYLRHYGVKEERFVRCYIPIDLQCFNRAHETRSQSRTAVRAQHGIPDNHLVLLMVGKFTETKRQRDLISFSNQIGRFRNDVTVVFAGVGRQGDALRRLARTHGPGGVVFAGFVQPPVLAQHYRAADLYVHCSERDAGPLTVEEAAFSGLPVVLSDRCGSYGPSSCVQPGRNGYVYPCGDVEAMTSALSRLLESHELRTAMGRASRSIGQDHQRLAHGEALLQALADLGLTAGRSCTTRKPESSAHAT